MEDWKCFLCGCRVIWGNDFMFEDYGMDGEGIVHTYTCSGCGAAYKVYEPIEKEDDVPQVDDRQITFKELEI